MKKFILVMGLVSFVCSCSTDNSCETGYAMYDGSCYPAAYSAIFTVTSKADILFVVDNSGSMVGEQVQLGYSFKAFATELERFFGDQYHVAVVTTGMESPGCPNCDAIITQSCMNETGENGRFQDRVCLNQGTIDNPDYTCTTDPVCSKVVTADSKSCFFDEALSEGMALVGINGCGYERGLASMRTALDTLAGSYNAGFLRKDATLVVVVISDEDDCGEVGDATEGMAAIGGNACYYAAKGVDPEGNYNDPEGKPYQLTPVEEYYDFLMGLKGNRQGMVKFAAVVGVKDIHDLSTTTIEYTFDSSSNHYRVDDACQTQGCTGSFCSAEPGTRYIRLAQMFGIGQHGFVDSICQNDFSNAMNKLGIFSACSDEYFLKDKLLDIDQVRVMLNHSEIPRFTCAAPGDLVECAGLEDSSCVQGSCVETWSYLAPSDPPDPAAPGGVISFADHCKPCQTINVGESFNLDIVEIAE
ncbi:MAG: hypothetical protein JRJ19_14025 [Deltaproteobacteria bacterium]|nr:hypothetical protein [Deltaproteobacteria bacterium]